MYWLPDSARVSIDDEISVRAFAFDVFVPLHDEISSFGRVVDGSIEAIEFYEGDRAPAFRTGEEGRLIVFSASRQTGELEPGAPAEVYPVRVARTVRSTGIGNEYPKFTAEFEPVEPMRRYTLTS